MEEENGHAQQNDVVDSEPPSARLAQNVDRVKSGKWRGFLVPTYLNELPSAERDDVRFLHLTWDDAKSVLKLRHDSGDEAGFVECDLGVASGEAFLRGRFADYWRCKAFVGEVVETTRGASGVRRYELVDLEELEKHRPGGVKTLDDRVSWGVLVGHSSSRDASASSKTVNAAGISDVDPTSASRRRARQQLEGVSLESCRRVHEFVNMEVEVDPASIELTLDATKGESGELGVNLTTVVLWNALRPTKLKYDEAGNAAANRHKADYLTPSPLSELHQVDYFNSFHVPQCPELRSVNGELPAREDEEIPLIKPTIKKRRVFDSLLDGGRSRLLRPRSPPPPALDAWTTRMLRQEAEFLLLATWRKNPGARDAIGLDIGRYQSTQRYFFLISPSSAFIAELIRYPWDNHNLNLSLEFEPLIELEKLQVSLETEEQPGHSRAPLFSQFQLRLPNSFSPELVLSTEATKLKIDGFVFAPVYGPARTVAARPDFHARPRVAPWPVGAYAQVRERIFEFNVRPFSLHITDSTRAWSDNYIYAASCRLNPEAAIDETSIHIRFCLIRHVLLPALSVLLPLWIIMTMQPFAYFLKYDDLSGVYGYIITLLLTTVAHRQIVNENSRSTRLTAADTTFLVTVTSLLAQMVLVSIIRRPLRRRSGVTSMSFRRFRMWLFVVHLVLDGIVILWSCLYLFRPWRALDEPDTVPSFHVDPERVDALADQRIDDETRMLPTTQFRRLPRPFHDKFSKSISLNTYRAWSKLQRHVCRSVLAALVASTRDDSESRWWDSERRGLLEHPRAQWYTFLYNDDCYQVRVGSFRPTLLIRHSRLDLKRRELEALSNSSSWCAWCCYLICNVLYTLLTCWACLRHPCKPKDSMLSVASSSVTWRSLNFTRAFAANQYLGFDRKTFFSYNVKALAKNQRPIDLFRMRVPRTFLKPISEKLGDPGYPKILNPYVLKEVYYVSLLAENRIPFEVQYAFTPDEEDEKKLTELFRNLEAALDDSRPRANVDSLRHKLEIEFATCARAHPEFRQDDDRRRWKDGRHNWSPDRMEEYKMGKLDDLRKVYERHHDHSGLIDHNHWDQTLRQILRWFWQSVFFELSCLNFAHIWHDVKLLRIVLTLMKQHRADDERKKGRKQNQGAPKEDGSTAEETKD